MPSRSPAAAALLAAACAAGGCERERPIVLTPEQEQEIRKDVLAERPKPEHGVGAEYGGAIRLLGYDLEPEPLRPGGRFTLTWYWESLAKVDRDWMVFVHLDAAGGKSRHNLDHHPLRGLYNAERWKPGEVVRDVQVSRLPAEFPGGEGELWVGFWVAEDRLAVSNGVKTDGHDRVLAGRPKFVGGEPPALPRLAVPRASAPVAADGRLDEPDWARAARTGPLGTPSGKGKARQRTEVRLLWDEANLYLAFECADDDAWSTSTEHDADLWEQDVVEVFIDPDGDGKTYAELQVSPAGVLFDASFPAHRSDLAVARAWSSGARHGVQVDGTLNARDDVDRSWTAELAVPWAALPAVPHVPPRPGDALRLNLFRLDKGKDGRQEAAAWSAPIRSDFHALDRFGHVTLQDAP